MRFKGEKCFLQQLFYQHLFCHKAEAEFPYSQCLSIMYTKEVSLIFFSLWLQCIENLFFPECKLTSFLPIKC